MKYFYCQSYLAFNFALNYKDVCILTSQEDIIKACEYFSIKFIKHDFFSDYDLLLRKKNVVNELERLTLLINNGQFHFSHSQYSVFCFLLAVNLKRNHVKCFFHDIEFTYPTKFNSFSINFFKTLIYTVFLNFIYVKIFEIRESHKNNFIIGVNPLFFRNISIEKYTNEKHQKIVENVFKNFNLEIKKARILFIDQGLYNNFFRSECIDDLLKILKSKSAIIKEHPIHTKVTTFDNFVKLPKFIPVEFYFKNFKGIVISSYSNSLFYAAKFPQIKAISLVYLLNDENYKKSIKQKLETESYGKIIFAYSLNELKDLVENYENPIA